MPNDAIQSMASSTLLSTVFDSFIPIALRISALLSAMIALVGGLIYLKQDNLLYFPEIGGIPRHNKDNPKGYRTPAYHNWPFEENQIECSDGVHIHSWLLFGDFSQTGSTIRKKSLPTIIYFHGNAGNIGLHLPNALQMILQLERTYNVLLVEYRGYGDSDSVPPTEDGLKRDAQAALQFCVQHPKIDHNTIILFGRSLGGAVAFHLAQYAMQNSMPVRGIIVENTFLSISAMVDKLMPKFIVMLKPLVLRLKWDSESIAPTLNNMPILYLAGYRDELVPHSHMKKLYELSNRASPGQVHIHVVPDGKHNDTWMTGGQDYWNAIRAFALGILTGGGLQDLQLSSTTMSVGIDVGSTTEFGKSLPTTSSSLLGMAKDAIGTQRSSLMTSSTDIKKDL